MTEITIDTVCTKGEVYPMLLHFQNGYPNEDFDSKCAVLQENGITTLATEIDDLVYYGKEVKEDVGKTLILARDRTTGKVRLIEVGCVDLVPYRKVDLKTPEQNASSKLELSRKFGSKKQKKNMEQREKLKIHVQTVAEQMETVTANVTVDQLDLSAYNKNDSDEFYIPPMDRDATKVEDVYPIEKILSEDEFENIYTEIKRQKYEDFYHPYVKSLVKGRTLSNELTVLAVYTSELIKFIHFTAQEIKKKEFKICKFSDTLDNVVFKNFTEIAKGTQKTRIRPLYMKDKVICHVIVFILLLNNFKFELEPLCAVLKISPKTPQFINKVRLIGAHIINTDGKKVHLKLPLAAKTSFTRRKSTKF